MPKCIVCKSMLPPNFLITTDDGLAKKCIFCDRGVDSVEYFSSAENKPTTTTKQQTIKEYAEFLKELNDMDSISNIMDAVKEKSGNILNV